MVATPTIVMLTGCETNKTTSVENLEGGGGGGRRERERERE